MGARALPGRHDGITTMIIEFDDTWDLATLLERRGFVVPSGYPGAAVRVSMSVVSGTVATPLTVKWSDAGGEHDFDTARTLTGTNTVFLTADDLQGVGRLVVTNPAAQTAVVRLVVGVESPEEGNGRPERQ